MIIYYASAHTGATQLNRQFISLLKRPLTHYWTFPLKPKLNGEVTGDQSGLNFGCV